MNELYEEGLAIILEVKDFIKRIKDKGEQNSQWALDFVDKLNELSISI
jgi:hypothetical protein